MPDPAEPSFSIDTLEGLRHETPFFVFSKARILATIEEYQRCFPDAVIHYAMKANSEPEILQAVADSGVGFEVASTYELDYLKALKVPASQMVYGTSVKPLSHIRDFHAYGVDCYAFDAPSELEKIAAGAPGAKVYVRVAVNDAGSVFKFSEKFGTTVDNVVPLLKQAQALGLVPHGISFHVGSQASNPKAWAQAIELLAESLAQLQELGIPAQMLNIGGGYPCAYADTERPLALSEIAEHTLAAWKALPYQPQLVLEPGRGIIATAGVLVASVIGRVERPGGSWLFLDAGVYNGLFETMAYQGSTRYRISSLRPAGDAGEHLFAIAGPTGDSPDIVTREARLPADLAVGDRLVIHDVGAYGLPACSPFNGFPKPPVHMA